MGRRFVMAMYAAAALLLCVPTLAHGQAAAPARVDLPPATVKSAAEFASVLNVVEMPNGNVVANDAGSRQLVMLDRALVAQRVRLDSAMSTTSYGRRGVSVPLCSCPEVWFPDGVLMDSARKAEIAERRASSERTRATGGFPGPDGTRIQMPPFEEPIVDSIPFERMPDCYPPIRAGAVIADLEGNVWILPTTSAQSRAGELVFMLVLHAELELEQ